VKAHAVLAVAAAIGLTSCRGRPDAAASAPAPVTHTITMEGVAFKPDDLTLTVGDSIVWVNKDAFAHTATAQGGSIDSKEVAAGASWTFQAVKPGEFPYVCAYHPTMKGVLRVK
jgi:plastocyanin